MLLVAFNFLQMKVADILDILLLGIIIFLAFRWLRGSSAMSIFVAIVSLYIIRVIVGAFDMRLMTAIMDMILDVGVLAIIVIFQPEIRKFLINLGNRYMNNAQSRAIIDRLLGRKKNNMSASEEVNNLTEACRRMSEDKTGALIVITRTTKLEEIIQTGITINADVNSFLIRNLFFNKAPLHDGAVVIDESQIVAAGCLLPLTRRQGIDGDLGTRHRAAIGMSETSDAIIIVVSEETGIISVAFDCALTRNFTPDSLRNLLLKKWVRENIDISNEQTEGK